MLHVHRSERTDALVAALGDALATPPADPFAPELVAVPTRGVERWLAQQLSMRLGVCANVEFPSPRRVVERALAEATGIDADEDPWAPERAVWPLLEVVGERLHEPWLADLARYLEHEDRRLATVRHLATLFDRYATHRPHMLQRWAAGLDDHWQAELWRHLRDRLDVVSPAERLPPATRRLTEEPSLLDLPERLAVFGLTRLPAARLQVLQAIAAHRDVHLHLLHPSPALWDAIDPPADPPRRRDDPTAATARHPLLASWGQDARELQLVLGAAADTDTHHPIDAPPPTLLGRLQHAVHTDTPPPADPGDRPALDPEDRSIEVHACHGRTRQVEVLRDAILHLLQDDPTLEPRDVLVMCPDIEAFAPLVHATFGAAAQDEDLPPVERPPTLHVRLADRALRQTNPLLAVLARLLELATGRITASEVLDLADREPVRRRFRLDDEDLARVEDWVAKSGVRWGLDAPHRATYKLDAVEQGTWRRGLDRLLLGAAMTEAGAPLVGGILPLDDVGSGDIDRAGRLAELVDRLHGTLAACNPQTAAGWADTLTAAADALTSCTGTEAWQRTELDVLLADLRREAGTTPTTVSVSELRDLLADRLKGRPTRANFRTGHITFCTLHPMRAVPHRVVCLLGLDDGAFPRAAPRDGDDLVLQDPRAGDRDGRLEDRQMLLDALLSATDRLVVTYTAKDERTNQRRPPAVPVGELLEVIEHTVRGFAEHEHPLQPFDPRAFDPERPFGHDPHALAGARALLGERTTPQPFLDGPLDAPAEAVVELDTLVRFVERPVRTFLRTRLGIAVAGTDDEPADDLPVELDSLQQWSVGQRLLDTRLTGTGHREALLAEIARGDLPPGDLGAPILRDRIAPAVQDVFCAVQQLAPGDATSVDVRTTLADGRALSGTVTGVVGDTVRFASYSRLDPKHRLAAWVRLLALTAARPDRPWQAVAIGRATGDATVAISHLAPLDEQAARDELAGLVALLDEGLREPLPIACRTSAAFAATGKQAAARRAWDDGWSFPGERSEPEHLLVGLDVPADPRFADLARRLWRGLLEHERLEQRG